MTDKNSEFTQILKKPNGAKFYWADFHIHTPAWHGFRRPSGINPTDEKWKKEFAKKYIEQAQEKDITFWELPNIMTFHGRIILEKPLKERTLKSFLDLR